jgi:UPF0755 protein
MSVRDGRSPRGNVPYDPAAFDEARYPVPGRLRRPSRGSGGGLPGVVRFLVFAIILGAIVLGAGLTVLRPLARAFVLGWAWDNTGSMRIGLVADFVREDLGTAPFEAPSDDPTEVVFEVQPGDTPASLAPRLAADGLINDGVPGERAFLFTAVQADLAPKLDAGLFLLRRNMAVEEVVDALVTARLVVRSVDVTFREGLRLEQMTAKLQTLDTGVDPATFYDLVKHPPATLLADFPWLVLPEGASLEGFLYPATYTLVVEASGGPFKVTTAEDLVRKMLEAFHDRVGDTRLQVPAERGLTFYQVVTLASIVEREAVLDEERPLIAGVYQNRLDGLRGVARVLNADPTVIYAVDTMNLDAMAFDQWQQYFFWSLPKTPLGDIAVREDLQGFQTYQVAGLIPSPICTPTVASIDAALAPNTGAGFLYFVAIPEGNGAHAFAKTLAEHNANLQKYGYR